MPSASMPRLEEQLRGILEPVLASEDFDIVIDETASSLEVITDDWTLHFENWTGGIAWLALDNEPESPAEYPAAIDSALGHRVMTALWTSNPAFLVSLCTALRAAADPLSHALVNALETTSAGN